MIPKEVFDTDGPLSLEGHDSFQAKIFQLTQDADAMLDLTWMDNNNENDKDERVTTPVTHGNESSHEEEHDNVSQYSSTSYNKDEDEQEALRSLTEELLMADALFETSYPMPNVVAPGPPSILETSSAKEQPPEAVPVEAVSPLLQIDDSILGPDLKVHGNGIIRFTGIVGHGSRCIRTSQPLAKPKAVPYAPGRSSSNGKRSSKLFQRLLGGTKSSPTTTTTTTTTTPFKHNTPTHTWKPFVAPFMLPDGTLSRTPRLVSYYEVHILHPDACKKNCVNQDHEEEEKVPEDQDLGLTTPTIAKNIPKFRKDDCIAVGMGARLFALNKSMPGWDALSHGYHSDDGSAFYNRVSRRHYGPAFGVGDVVGCGIDYRTAAIFYTLNGCFLGYSFQFSAPSLASMDWYPVIGIDSHACVQCNFGTSRPFLFDLQRMCENGTLLG